MNSKQNYVKLMVFIFVSLFILSGCGNEGVGSSEQTPSSTFSSDDFLQESVIKVLPNGEKFTISNIQLLNDIAADGNRTVYTAKIDESGEGFFVLNANSVEGTFSKDGKTYSLSQNGQIQEVASHNDGGGVFPSSAMTKEVDIGDYATKYRATTTPEIKILFIYNEDFWQWNDQNTVNVTNKFQAMLDYTNSAFSRSGIHANVSLAGSVKLDMEHENDDTGTFLDYMQPRLNDSSDTLYQLREEYEADIVFVVKKVTYLESGWSFGMAYYTIFDVDVSDTAMDTAPDFALGVQDITTSINYEVFTHELGHVFGCNHDYSTRIDEGSVINYFNFYANGYWFSANGIDYTTLMGYDTGGRTTIPYFSNPNIDYNGVPTGRAGDNELAADCARFINLSAPLVAEFRAAASSTVTPSSITSPSNGSTLSSSSQTFTWEDTGADQYYLYVGTIQGGYDLYADDQGTGTSITFTNLAVGTIYFRLWSLIDGDWYYSDSYYEIYSDGFSIPAISEAQKAEYLDAINAIRAQTQDCGTEGVFPAVSALSWSDALYSAAYEHSYDMAYSGVFSHDGSGTVYDITAQDLGLSRGSFFYERIGNYNYNWSAVGENIAAGNSTVDQVMAQWMASDSHCANIMSSNYTEIGMALVTVSSGYGYYWTQDFGSSY